MPIFILRTRRMSTRDSTERMVYAKHSILCGIPMPCKIYSQALHQPVLPNRSVFGLFDVEEASGADQQEIPKTVLNVPWTQRFHFW
jgi:hypothetical protein